MTTTLNTSRSLFSAAPSNTSSAALLQHEQPSSSPPRLIPIESVSHILGLKNSAIHAKVASGELPPPIKFGNSRRAAARWIESEITSYVLTLAAARRYAPSTAEPE
ncbi:helix-turn-helix transcriptional regulator [Achromobacter xylosoxidans]|uniref:helix-turn-helix transcriptional regulator n=1 Tax=Alcaligenes xylosoxydans xylosoxydans TaxID=85698 RepID=UPI000D6E17A6|nr:AlpA family phage regulatory protein [Achromobacter xylosoxidans]NEV05027.1 AlpA family phage regulatory protein [Achromobacter xylosoxidans]